MNFDEPIYVPRTEGNFNMPITSQTNPIADACRYDRLPAAHDEATYFAAVADLSDQAAVHHARGQFGQAKGLYRRALAIQEQVLGPAHIDVATTLNHLAVLYASEGNMAEAGGLYEQCLSLLERALGTDHPQTQVCRENLEWTRGRGIPCPG
jgi:tetratricopeptide (TPR) repeat protein